MTAVSVLAPMTGGLPVMLEPETQDAGASGITRTEWIMSPAVTIWPQMRS